MQAGPELLLTLREQPVQVFDRSAFQWILPRKNPGFEQLVNQLGLSSAKERKLRKPSTSMTRFIESIDENQKLFILWETLESKPIIHGYAKTTRKTLYLRDQDQKPYVEQPLSFMDVFIEGENKEIAVQLIDHVLRAEEVEIHECAFDCPPQWLLTLLSTHYGLVEPVEQAIKFVVFPSFFTNLSPTTSNDFYSQPGSVATSAAHSPVQCPQSVAWLPTGRSSQANLEHVRAKQFAAMNLKYLTTLLEPQDQLAQITSLDFAANGNKLAVVTADRVIRLYDDKWVERDKFPTKPIESQFGKRSYQVRSIAFSPDSSKLAVAQTDNIVFVYRLGDSCPNKKSLVSGHIDGSIILYSFESRVQTKIVVHSTAPYCLLLTNFGILAAGSDRRIVSYTEQGRLQQQYDYNKDPDEKEFSAAVLDPTGLNVVFGSYNRLRLMSWNVRRGAWDDCSQLTVQNMYAITALAWKADGASLAAGTMLGAVICVDCCLRRTLLKGQFETTFVSPSQVVIRDIKSDCRCSLRSSKGLHINDLRMVGRDNRNVVAYTPHTLIVADMITDRSSEIEWSSGGNEKFYVDNENVCMIVNAGEISIVEYGRNEVVGWLRSERISPHLISVRLGEQRRKTRLQLRRVAYMLDVHTIHVLDLATNQTAAQITHNSVVDWLELNETAEKILFRDVRSALYLYNIDLQKLFTMVNVCSYVQWVPQSDVIVAQSNDQLCVWYDADNLEQVVQLPVLGDVENVLRDQDRTEVIVHENNAKVAYELDNRLIEFATAIDDRDLNRALAFLETSEKDERADVASMWRQMGLVALQEGQLVIAQRCFAGLRDFSKVRFVEDTIDLIAEYSEDHYEAKARLALLNKDLKEAERVYLENNAKDKAIEMYKTIHKWTTAIDLAKATNYADMESLRRGYMKYLNETGQEDRMAEIKVEDGKVTEAVDLYLQSNKPARAAVLMLENNTALENDVLCNSVIDALLRSKVFGKAGELLEVVGRFEEAMENYRLGDDYNKAVQLARIHFPEKVIELEEAWGEHLSAKGEHDQAISHFLESGNNEKAVGAAIKAKEWDKALEVADSLDKANPNTSNYFCDLARYFESNGMYDKAERFYVNANMANEAVDMYNKAGRWSDAFTLAKDVVGEEQSREQYYEKAKELDERGQCGAAEELYLAVGEPNDAIAMYKRLNRLEDMMRLVNTFHADQVEEAHKRLAEDLIQKREFRAAEEQLVVVGDWKSAVNMYKEEGQWADAYRVATTHGGDNAHKQVAFLWAQSLGGESGLKLLQRYGILDEAIDIGIERGNFDFVFELCRMGANHRLNEVQVKRAEALEDSGDFEKAEEFYLQSGKEREAVLMYLHNKEWEHAERLASQHAPDMANQVFIHRARAALEEQDPATAESYLLRANRADIILNYYRSAGQWEDAVRIARDYVPEALSEVEAEFEMVQLRSGAKGAQSFMVRAQDLELEEEYAAAVENYLKVDAPLTEDLNMITQAYVKAGQLVSKFLNDDEHQHLISRIGERLSELGEHVQASQVYLAGNQNQEAITQLIKANEWSKAQKVAVEVEPEMVDVVDSAYKEYLKNQGRVGELIDVDVLSAIDAFVEQGSWEKALTTAAKQNHPQLVDKYVTMYVTELLKEDRYMDAIMAFEQYGTPLNTFNTYKMLIDMVVNKRGECYESLSHLRNMILKLNQSLANAKEEVDERIIDVFERYQYVTHYQALIAVLEGLESSDAQSIRLKLKISMLRYLDLVQPDKIFFEAGIACREVRGYERMAFTLLNQYIDIVNAVELNEPDDVNNDIFERTDVPIQFTLPQRPYITGDEHEEVNEWVLGMSVDQKIERELKTDERGCYEASTIDSDGRLYPACIVCGYPVLHNPKSIGSDKVADPNVWHQFVTLIRTNPVNDLFDVQAFLSRWTGTTVTLSY